MWQRLFERKPLEPYLPAMWPVAPLRLAREYLQAWRWRRRMRELLEAERAGRLRFGSERSLVEEGARVSLRRLVVRRRKRNDGA